ncbi:hypothetical protein JCM11491_002280 [Sporobolomyces phaffii]
MDLGSDYLKILQAAVLAPAAAQHDAQQEAHAPFTDLSNLLRSPSTSKKPLERDAQHSSEHSSASPNSTKPLSAFHEQFASSFSYSDDSLPPTSASSHVPPQTSSLALNSISISSRPVSFDNPDDDSEEHFEYLSDEHSVTGGGRMYWQPRNRECSPVLEEQEAESSSFFSAHQTFDMSPPRTQRYTRYTEAGTRAEEPSESVETHGDADDSFVTARGFVGESPVKARESREEHQRAQWEGAEEDQEEDEEDYRQQDSPTTSFASSSRNGGAIDTPDTSFPSTPGEDSRGDCQEDGASAWLSSTPSKNNLATIAASPPEPSLTPPKVPRFVEVVETCPTPEQAEIEEQRRLVEEADLSPLKKRTAGTTDEARRRRSLFKTSELGYGYYDEGGGHDDNEGATEDLEEYLRTAYRAREVGRASYTSPTASHLDLHRSYAPSLVQPEEPSSTASTPRARSRQSTRTDLFPTVSAAELVVASLLSSRSLASQVPSQPTTSGLAHMSHRHSFYSNYYDPSLPFDSPPRAPSPLKHVRPLSYSHSQPQSNPSRSRQTTTTTARRSALVPKTSTSTLFTYDLSHLPAPDTPLEQPYRVKFLDVLKPSGYLGGGRGSGKFGDRWGAVERKGPPRRSLSGIRGESDRADTPFSTTSTSSVFGGRKGSIRRSLSRWTNRTSSQDLAAVGRAAESDDAGEGGLKPSRSIRRSLSRSLSAFSVTGRRRRRGEAEAKGNENLDQWVSVVVA